MSFLKNTVSLLAIFSVLPVAHAVTARPSIMNTATAISAKGTVRRMPTMTALISGSAAATGTTSSATSSALLENSDCIDAYTACIKGADACGPNFEECTTNVLFHAQMPECLSTLAQCSSNGVNSLFGTSNVSALSDVATKNTYGEITEYTYPTAGSVLGQMISAAAIENQYDTSNCVRRYSSCLRKDSVCGADFELCTTNTEFKKQAVFCDSTLARCASDGKLELFGNASATSSTVPSASSRIGEMIAEGAALAAVNAVSTCYKVADQCILNACAENPYKCYEDSSVEIQSLVESINNGTPVADAAQQFASDVYSKQDVRAYVKNACESTIGSNKYCYATFLGDGVMPTASQLRDEDNVADVFDQAYSARMNSSMNAKITELVNKFDTRAKEKCVETITSCAMRSCGGGSGAACYSLVFSDSGDNSINGGATRDDIKTACQSVVSTDANCLYAAKNPNSVGTYNYSFIQADAFDTLFPEYEDGAESDPIGVVASLNAKLATSYNDAAIAQMKKRCQSVATSCVKSMCGNDYVNCYRNRTDIYSSLTNTGEDEFDKSMNKVGGVLDYTIVLGLCVDTVKNASVCEEHLAIEQVKVEKSDDYKSAWGDASSAHDGWVDAGQFSLTREGSIVATDSYGNPLCSDNCGNEGICDTASSVSECGVYEKPVMIAKETWSKNRAADTLFKDLIYDLEIEAQAKYNAKLTKQQNMCLSSNDGGILGKDETGSTFMWAKLRGSKVPANYTIAGLKPNQFVASNDLYGSFCRVRITLQSDDKYIQDKINSGADWATAYFAAGDAFVCGSWIPNDKLEELAKQAGEDAAAEKKVGQHRKIVEPWTAVAGLLGGGVGGAYLGAGIQDGSVFSGLTGKIKKDTKELTVENCNKYYNTYTTAVADVNTRATVPTYVNNLINLVESNTTDSKKLAKATAASVALSQYQSALSDATQTFVDQYGSATERDCTPAEKEQRAIDKANAKIRQIATSCPVVLQDFNIWKTGCVDGQTDVMQVGSKDYDTECCGTQNANYNAARAEYNSVYANGAVCKVQVAAGVTNSVAQQQAMANNNVLTKKSDLDAKMSDLRSTCVTLANDENDSDEQAKKKRAAAGVGATLTAVAGGVLTWGITRSIMDAQVDNAKQEAIKEFMDNVGSKIRCYIGGEEVGTYGDVISTSME